MGAQVSSLHNQDTYYDDVGQPDVIKACYKDKAMGVPDDQADRDAKPSAVGQRRVLQRFVKSRTLPGLTSQVLLLPSPRPVSEAHSEDQTVTQTALEQRLLSQQELLLQENIRLHKELLWVTQQYMAGLQELEGLRKYHRGCQQCACCRGGGGGGSSSDNRSPTSLSLQKLHPLTSSVTRQQQQQQQHQEAAPSAYSTAATAGSTRSHSDPSLAAAATAGGGTATVVATAASSGLRGSGSKSSSRGMLAKAAKRFGRSATFSGGSSSSKAKAAAAAAAAAAASGGGYGPPGGLHGGYYYEGQGFTAVKPQDKVIVDVGKLLGFTPA